MCMKIFSPHLAGMSLWKGCYRTQHHSTGHNDGISMVLEKDNNQICLKKLNCLNNIVLNKIFIVEFLLTTCTTILV